MNAFWLRFTSGPRRTAVSVGILADARPPGLASGWSEVGGEHGSARRRYEPQLTARPAADL